MDRQIVGRGVGIDCGHRVPVHGSPCASIHGHRFEVTALCSAEPPMSAFPGDTPISPVFAFLPDVLRSEVSLPCDGAMLLWVGDPLADVLRPAVLLGVSHLAVDQQGWWEGSGEFGRLYLLADPPTPGNLARHWFARLDKPVKDHSGGRAELVGVKVRMSPDMAAAFGPVFRAS